MPTFTLIPSDGPSEQELAKIEASVRASIVTDFLKARRQGDSLGQLEAEYLAAQIDRHAPEGPRLLDEIDALRYRAA
ncbi:hypothetical protein [Streptomyces zaomyceticus]|uniref:hypothetical protein n=1 Tax=Streptomyces zaomyceticus TaxID=68286 RepID=UPI002E15B367|nr:hypothetical protein OG237_06485 [Streptomyces zaomyceticus]